MGGSDQPTAQNPYTENQILQGNISLSYDPNAYNEFNAIYAAQQGQADACNLSNIMKGMFLDNIQENEGSLGKNVFQFNGNDLINMSMSPQTDTNLQNLMNLDYKAGYNSINPLDYWNQCINGNTPNIYNDLIFSQNQANNQTFYNNNLMYSKIFGQIYYPDL